MIRWSLMAEYFSLLILLILFIRYYCYEWRVAFTSKRKLYLGCLLISVASIVLNVVCVYTLSRTDIIPQWLNVTLNTLYFYMSIGMCSLFAALLLVLVLEHVYDRRPLRRALLCLLGLTALYLLLVSANLFTGNFFYFDAAGNYQRGPLNSLGYTMPMAELALVAFYYFRNRTSIVTSMVYVMRSLPPIVLMLCLFQFLYPEILLNGTISAIASLILFLSFQSSTTDRDSLTGIRNRNNFMTELSIRLSARQPIEIILVSLLSFSDVNLQYGHRTGDAILYEAARYLDHLHPQGRAFRIGNVTFALVLPEDDRTRSEQLLQTIQDRFQAPWTLGELQCRLNICMVQLRCGAQGGSPGEVVEQMEYALSLAKQERGLVRFDERVRRQLLQKKELVEIMQRSIRERRFRVWYQPIYSCASDDFHCAEALLRLTDYHGNAVSPSVFIPLAEETGLIGELTWLVLEDICRTLSSGQVPGLQSVSLNLSMQQFLDPELTTRIQNFLTQYHLKPECLKVEITERFLLHDARHAKRQLGALSAAGIQLYMDDFGTGYSNLSSVLDYPFACIKLDRSLVCHALEDRRADLMVKTLMNLFRQLGKELVVEGVENRELAAHMKRCGADMIQGFYYAAPMSREELEAFFARQENSGAIPPAQENRVR